MRVEWRRRRRSETMLQRDGASGAAGALHNGNKIAVGKEPCEGSPNTARWAAGPVHWVEGVEKNNHFSAQQPARS
jgi:hypothetical protein